MLKKYLVNLRRDVGGYLLRCIWNSPWSWLNYSILNHSSNFSSLCGTRILFISLNVSRVSRQSKMTILVADSSEVDGWGMYSLYILIIKIPRDHITNLNGFE